MAADRRHKNPFISSPVPLSLYTLGKQMLICYLKVYCCMAWKYLADEGKAVSLDSFFYICLQSTGSRTCPGLPAFKQLFRVSQIVTFGASDNLLLWEKNITTLLHQAGENAE